MAEYSKVNRFNYIIYSEILEMMQPFDGFDEFELFDSGQNLVELRHIADVDDKSTGGDHVFRCHLRVADIDIKG
jgi:hypothetical protein